ncbi:MAG: hypothetical protein F6K11_23540 [Leptolyngbya sp. SIO3F4]|nr:hypothetical protein [Leptolyngbya sp. SIO3F4]
MTGRGPMIQSGLAQTPNRVETQTNLEQIKSQLIGQWEYTFSEDKDPISFFLAPHGVLFMLTPWGEAIRFTWTLEIIDQQPTMVSNVGSVQLIGTPSSSTTMSLRLVDLLNIDQTTQETTTHIAQKLSSESILPEDITTIDAADYYQRQAITSRQWSARLQVSQINRAQQIHFSEHQEFVNAQTILGLSLSASEFYTYQISLSDDGQAASVLALPKQPGFIAYLGRVAPDSLTSANTLATICESLEPTLQPLQSIPTLTEADFLTCPEGYISPSARSVDLDNRRAIQSLENRIQTTLGSINRTQQLILTATNNFEDNIQALARKLAIDLQNEKYYEYQIALSEDGLTANILAIPKHAELRTFVGRARATTHTINPIHPSSIQCASIAPTLQIPDLPPVINEELTCPNGYVISD